jgi:hypothetical protein
MLQFRVYKYTDILVKLPINWSETTKLVMFGISNSNTFLCFLRIGRVAKNNTMFLVQTGS